MGWTFLAPSLPAAVHSVCPPCFFLWARTQLFILLLPFSVRLLLPGKFKGNTACTPEPALNTHHFTFSIEPKTGCHLVLNLKLLCGNLRFRGVGCGPLVSTCLWGSGWAHSDQADKDVMQGMSTNLLQAAPPLSFFLTY